MLISVLNFSAFDLQNNSKITLSIKSSLEFISVNHELRNKLPLMILLQFIFCGTFWIVHNSVYYTTGGASLYFPELFLTRDTQNKNLTGGFKTEVAAYLQYRADPPAFRPSWVKFGAPGRAGGMFQLVRTGPTGASCPLRADSWHRWGHRPITRPDQM